MDKIAITTGDPNGIGAEITIKALNELDLPQDKIVLISNKDVLDYYGKLDKKYDYYGASGVIDKVDRYLFDKPLLLVGEDGANLLLRSKPIAFIASGQYWVNNHAHVIDAVAGVDLRYIALFINATNLAPYVTGTAQPKMNQEKLNSILVPLPPTNEQRRIVSAFEGIAAIIQQS